MIEFMKSHPEYFPELIAYSLSDNEKYAWRASWLLWSCIEPNDKRLRKYVNKIVECLPTKKDNQQRELLILLQKMDIESSLDAQLIDICIRIWKKKQKSASLRYNAFKLLIQIARNYPELSKEIQLLTEPHYIAELSATAQKAVLKLTKELQ